MTGDEGAPPKQIRSPAVTLSKKTLATSVGRELLGILQRITSDGRIAEAETRELQTWLEGSRERVDFPALSFLREEITAILADGALDEGECIRLQKAIERVLPPEERAQAAAQRAQAEEEDRKRFEAEERAANPATEKQRSYIGNLGGECPPNATKREASDVITMLLAEKPTNRQMMVLRFWNRLDLTSAGVEGVSDWLDQWYDKDENRKAAWELWKQEHHDTGGRSADVVATVPIGIGPQYLERIRRMDADAVDDLLYGRPEAILAVNLRPSTSSPLASSPPLAHDAKGIHTKKFLGRALVIIGILGALGNAGNRGALILGVALAISGVLLVRSAGRR